MAKVQYSRSRMVSAGAAMWVAVAACSGDISIAANDPAGSSAYTGNGPDSPSGGNNNPPGSIPRDPSGNPVEPGPGGDGVTPTAIAPAPATRTARLTHAQWENSVRDLLSLGSDSAFSTLLRSDPLQAGFMFDNDALSMSVDEALWSGYQQAAGNVAEFVTTDGARLAAIAPDTGNASTRADQFVRAIGLRAYRRPLTDAEVTEYRALFAQGASFYDGVPEFTAGVRVVVEAMLQAPNFLYRIETSDAVSGGMIPLSSYEVATRLSYALWNTMPDAALFAAAAADQLRDPAAVAEQAERMLDDPRAQATVQHFHDQLFEVDRFESIRPSPSRFPDLPADFGALAATENRLFVRETVFNQRGSYADLLTSSETFVNAGLAKIYGVPGSVGSDFSKVSLDPSTRAGIFTQIGFLALHATSVNPDPIHRGVFLARRITCTEVSAPPANIPPLPEPQGRTNRETIEAHTQKEGTICAGCHAPTINPLGFPFENFDAIGKLRTTDNGHPIDTHSDAWTGAERVSVAGAVELAQALAESRAVHECYVRHFLEFTYGRPRTAQDAPLITQLGGRSLSEGLPVADLIVSLVTSPAFLNRSAQELP